MQIIESICQLFNQVYIDHISNYGFLGEPVDSYQYVNKLTSIGSNLEIIWELFCD